MVYNALAGTAVGLAYGMELCEIKRGIEKLQPVSGRFNIIETDKYTIVDDCYNANPMSMKASLQIMKDALGRKVPTYETMIKRLAGIGACCEYIKELSVSEDVHDSVTIMEQLAVRSKGVVKVVTSKDSSFGNLAWVEAELEEYDLKGSKLGSESGLATLKNALLHCKYEGADDLIAAAKAIDKRVKEASNKEDEEAASDYAVSYTVPMTRAERARSPFSTRIISKTVFCSAAPTASGARCKEWAKITRCSPPRQSPSTMTSRLQIFCPSIV